MYISELSLDLVAIQKPHAMDDIKLHSGKKLDNLATSLLSFGTSTADTRTKAKVHNSGQNCIVLEGALGKKVFEN